MKSKLVILMIFIVLIIVVICMWLFRGPSYYKTELPFEANDGKIMGIIQIGESKLDYDYSVIDKYFKTREFETIEFGGTEKYLIIPREDTIAVYYLELKDDGGVEEKYVKNMFEPFYITCNVSDIISNSLLRVVEGSKQYSYSPYISLKDGSLVVEDFVLHIY